MIKVEFVSKSVFAQFVEGVDKSSTIVQVHRLPKYNQVHVDCCSQKSSKKMDSKWIFSDDSNEMRYTCKHIARNLVITDYSNQFNDFFENYCEVKPAKEKDVEGQISFDDLENRKK